MQKGLDPDTHMDYELDNVLIDDDGPIVIDWQKSYDFASRC